MLPTRKLGTQGLEVSALGLGCFGMSASYGTPDEAESIATIHRAVDLGVTHFDTAEIYGPYSVEGLLGRAVKGRRHGLVIATKVGFRLEGGRVMGPDSRPDRIRVAVEGSLKRLGTGVIDLLYQHRVDPAVPIEDVVGTMGRMVEAGHVRFIGLSEAGEATIRRAHATHPLSVLQSEYSLWERNLEPRIIPLLRELGIGLVPFGPLGRGFLAGTARRAEEYPDTDFRRDDPRLRGGNYDANLRAARVLSDVAARLGVEPGQAALAWLLARGPDIAPIPGTKRVAFVEENVAAADIELPRSDLDELEAALRPERVSGARYGPDRMALVDR